VFTMVTDDAAVRAIFSGANGILAGLQAGQVYVDMSTISPRTSREVARQVRAVGAQMLDAPVSGSIPQAESGTLAIMVGGDPQAFAAVEQLLRELAQTVTHIGPNGQGLVLKLAINISLAVQTLAFSEGLLLAERAGVEPAVAAEVMSTSSIGSPMLKARVPCCFICPKTRGSTWSSCTRTSAWRWERRRTCGSPLPSAAVADEVLTTARRLGYGHRDLASLHQVLANTSVGIERAKVGNLQLAYPAERSAQNQGLRPGTKWSRGKNSWT